LARRRCPEADPIDVPSAGGDVDEPLQARSQTAMTTTTRARSERLLPLAVEQVGERRRDSLEDD
jgi:hypothetical protein